MKSLFLIALGGAIAVAVALGIKYGWFETVANFFGGLFQ